MNTLANSNSFILNHCKKDQKGSAKKDRTVHLMKLSTEKIKKVYEQDHNDSADYCYN